MPLVPVPEDPPPERDVFAALLQQRIVFLNGVLTPEAAAHAAAQIMMLNAEGDDAVHLHLSCPDGDLDAALALADTVDLATVPVDAVGRGTLGGPALAPFLAAGRRRAYPHAVFRLSEPRATLDGRSEEIAAGAEAIHQQLGHLHARLAEATGQSLDKVVDDMRTGRILTAAQACDYGLVLELVGGSD
ncbi:MAG: ATP-dependent Clp protease proteolytic subunit [Actinomycetota bacterium]|nr:ATP-dependent Clp protease proteolytic subunit [Actinomycetota bacterium]